MDVRIVEAAAVTSGAQDPIVHLDLSECHAAIVICSIVTSNGTPVSDRVMSIGVMADQNGSTSSPSQSCSYIWSDDGGADSACTGGGDDDAIIALPSSGAGFNAVATADFVDTTNGSGIQLSWSNYPADNYLIKVVLFGGSDVSAHVDVVAAVEGGLDVTAPGFEPRAVFFVGNEGSTLAEQQGGLGVNAAISFGCAHNGPSSTVTQKSACHLEVGSGNPEQDPKTNVQNDHAVQWCTTFATSLWRHLDVSAFDSSGFTVTTTDDNFDDPPNTMYVTYLAIDFNAEQGFWLGDLETPTATGPTTDSETGPGFTPQIIGICATHANTVNVQEADDGADSFGIGFTTSDTTASITVACEDDAATMNSQSHASSSNLLDIYTDGDTVQCSASLSSLDENGFTLNYSDTDTSARLGWVFAIEENAGAQTQTLNTTVDATESIVQDRSLFDTETVESTESFALGMAQVHDETGEATESLVLDRAIEFSETAQAGTSYETTESAQEHELTFNETVVVNGLLIERRWDAGTSVVSTETMVVDLSMVYTEDVSADEEFTTSESGGNETRTFNETVVATVSDVQDAVLYFDPETVEVTESSVNDYALVFSETVEAGESRVATEAGDGDTVDDYLESALASESLSTFHEWERSWNASVEAAEDLSFAYQMNFSETVSVSDDLFDQAPSFTATVEAQETSTIAATSIETNQINLVGYPSTISLEGRPS